MRDFTDKEKQINTMHPGISEDGAYRGYLIRFNHFTGAWLVSKDGQHITSARSRKDAEREIDALCKPHEAT